MPYTYLNSVTTPASGKIETPGVGMQYRFSLSNVIPDSHGTLTLTDTLTAYQEQYGFGDVTGVNFTYCFTVNDKVYGLSGNTVYVSAIGDATTWNDLNGLGNGFIKLVNWYSSPEPLVSAMVYQGKLLFLTRTTSQVWTIDADLAQWRHMQTIPNLGTIAARSVAALGELDVIFLSDSGIRSFRAREVTLNATVVDIGSAIDGFIASALSSLTNAQRATACSIVEPSQSRYWLFIPNVGGTAGDIWVLNYFPEAKIVAWSRYYTSDDSGQDFVPSKFCVYNGQVYARGENAIYLYGGSDNNTYDATYAYIEIPFFDMKLPGTDKLVSHMDINATEAWEVYGTPNYESLVIDTPIGIVGPTYDKGWVAWPTRGTHFSVALQTQAAAPARVSGITLYYNVGTQPTG